MPHDHPTFSALPQWLHRWINPLSRRPVWQIITVAILATLGLTITTIELFVVSRWAIFESVQGLIWLIAGVATLITFMTAPISFGGLVRSSLALAQTNGVNSRWSWWLVGIAITSGGAIGLLFRRLF